MQVIREVSLSSRQRLLLSIYTLGVVLSLGFNSVCYAGTFIGVCGWAFIWPFYFPAVLARLLILHGTGITWGMVCMG
jgi:hypothetical protein